MKKYLLLLTILLLLAACGNKDDEEPVAPVTNNNDSGGVLTASDAETALQAYFSGDYRSANPYFCPEEQTGSETEAAYGNAKVENLSCERSDNHMNCSYKVTIGEGDNPFVIEESVSYLIQNEKLCAADRPRPEE